MIFVTGGAGFIGSNFIHYWLKNSDQQVLNIDKLTYAGNLSNLQSLASNPQYSFLQLDINSEKISELFEKHKPAAIVHFAAESHVDRSISGPTDFIQTNIVGTFNLLEASRKYWNSLAENKKSKFRFLHISTDEVFGSLTKTDIAFHENSAFAPNSPYSASKAASDHLVRAYFHTYNLPVVTTHCSNNYGPFQFPEKFIPVIIQSCLSGRSIPIYGDGSNVRDWLFVEDHCNALNEVLKKGHVGETYNIGGQCEKSNLDVVDHICRQMDELRPRYDKKSYSLQKSFVTDRRGHDWRYAINIGKISKDLGWRPQKDFNSGIKSTIAWYLENQTWVKNVTKKEAT